MMKLAITFIALIATIAFSGVTQSDSTLQKKTVDDSAPQKVVVAIESPKTLSKALLVPKTRTTWTSIKDLFK